MLPDTHMLSDTHIDTQTLKITSIPYVGHVLACSTYPDRDRDRERDCDLFFLSRPSLLDFSE